MIHVRVREREAQAKSTEPITAGSVGLQVGFRFSDDWGELAKCAVFRGSGVSIDVALLDDACAVPAEVLAQAGGHLKIGVYGCVVDENEDLAEATPTIWADAGVICEGAEPSGIEPTPQTAELVDQILAAAQAAQEAAEDAAEIAQSVRDDADAGDFDGADGADGQDGYSPTVTVTEIAGGHEVTITDVNGDHTFDVMDGEGGGGSGGQFTVELEYESGVWTANKTYAQTAAAITAGKTTVVKFEDHVFYYQINASGNLVFANVTDDPAVYLLYLTSGDVWSFAEKDLFGFYTKPSGGIPKTDLASGVQTSLGLADTALQSAPVTSVNGYTGAVTLSIPSTAGDVGAIPAPASPSSGDVLTYSSGAWAAAAPAHQIPAGGNAGECLAKNSSSNYDLRWRTINDWTPAGLMRTAGGTAAKVAEWSFWSATQYPAWLVVTVGNSNTYAGAITLKVNGSTAYPIYINGAASSATNYTLPAGSYFVYFDGSKFDFRTDGKLPGDIIGHAGKDIQAPASPTTGDFLVWNGSAWAAMSLSTWQGGNY